MSEGYLGSPKSQAKMKDLQRRMQREADDDLRAAMGTQAGRRLLFRLLDGRCGVFGGAWAGDPVVTVYNDGRRSVGVELLRDAQRVAPREWMTMLNEELVARERLAQQRTGVESEAGPEDVTE